METIIDRRKLREIIPTLPFTLQLNGNLKPEDWKDMDQVLQLHKLLKDLFQWSMENKRFNIAPYCSELGAFCQKEREARIRENQATIQAIEEQLNQKEHSLIPSGSKGVDQPNSPVASHHSHHSGTSRSVAKSHHYSQFQALSRRRQGSKGKNKNSFSQRQKGSDTTIQRLFDLVKEVNKSHK
ncbi:hypothetical protein O181_006366 [Austropuccinia psidii MF-1]|uniref:Uncharacterized protein n=1 Tax=Austropuccinia psidii MF-1 TaxID=1389203 RepID=A0A9Q3BJ19_9BASI|nr:hypothetical protein [Austropuccinia psidii MF-1]